MSSSVAPGIIAAVSGAVLVATLAVTFLTHRTAKMYQVIVEREGIAALSSYENMGQLVMHLCLLFALLAFSGVSIEVITHGEPLVAVIGFGAFVTGLSVKRYIALSKGTCTDRPKSARNGGAA